MKPFFDVGQFKTLKPPETTAPRFSPQKIGYGNEIRNGRDLNKRKFALFISSGKWAEMPDDGLIDQEVSPLVIGQTIDVLDFSPYLEQNERKSAIQVLESGEIISEDSIDFSQQTSKDGRITVFEIRSRGYIDREEIPYKSRGIKVDNSTILGYSVGKSFNPYFDGGDSELGISRTGFYGKEAQVSISYYDHVVENSLGFDIIQGDYVAGTQQGSHGFVLYSSEFGTDSIAYAGFLK